MGVRALRARPPVADTGEFHSSASEQVGKELCGFRALTLPWYNSASASKVTTIGREQRSPLGIRPFYERYPM